MKCTKNTFEGLQKILDFFGATSCQVLSLIKCYHPIFTMAIIHILFGKLTSDVVKLQYQRWKWRSQIINLDSIAVSAFVFILVDFDKFWQNLRQAGLSR